MTALRTMRTDRRFTIREVANKSGVSEGYYRMIERGARQPPVYLLEEILRAMGIEFRTVGNKIWVGDISFECVPGRVHQQTDNQLLTEIRDLLEQLVDLAKGNGQP